ncbi:MAG: hypothetical protein PVJ85_12290, partial [Anaerolineae bacterium]
ARSALLAGSLVILAVVGTAFLYREAVGLPFFFDDMIHLRWLDWHSLPAIWTTAEGLGYYRPLTMSVWKLGHLLLGYNEPRLMHLLNLVLHAANTVLVGAIAWRAGQGRVRGVLALVAVVLFVSYPFSYQAVPSTSSLSKPLIATLVMICVLLYWEGRRRASRWWLVASLVAGLLAPFAYETGVTIPLAILAVEALGRSRQEFERFSWLPGLYAVLIWGVALPVVVLMEPETGASVRLPAWMDLWQNSAFFLQGLLYPISHLATPLERVLSLDRYVLMAAIGVAGLGALFAFYYWVKQVRWFLFALAWLAVGLLPLWLMLDFGYVINSPRILYLGGVGSALLWAGVPVFLWEKLERRWWATALAIAALTAVLVFSSSYVRQKLTLADAVARSLWQTVHAAEERGSDASLLYLNVPVWVAPKEPIYRVGTEGLTFIPDYVRVQDFVYVNGRWADGGEPDIRSRAFDPAKQDWAAFLGYLGQGASREELAEEVRLVDGVYLTTYGQSRLGFAEAGSLQPSGAEPGEIEARFGETLVLQEAQVRHADETLEVHLWWTVGQPPDGDVTVFLHVYDAAGELVAQADGYPLAGLLAPQQWQAGDLVHDIRPVQLPPDVVGQPFTVVTGWYDTSSGLRLPAVDGQGQPVTDDAVPLYP